MKCSQPGIQHAQEIMNLGHRAHGRTGIARQVALPDGNCRAQSLNAIHFGSIQTLQKLPGARRQRFEVASFALGKDRIKSQRRLPGTTDPGDHDEAVAGQGDVYIFEIMLSCATNDNVVHESIIVEAEDLAFL